MTRYALAYVASGIVFAALDMAWLSLAGPALYRPMLGSILAERFSAPPAVAFYLLYVLGITVFASAPGLRAESWTKAAMLGALLGLIAYATYDLTNQATLKVWATRITLADMAWGAFATATAAAAGVKASLVIARMIGGG